MKTTTTNSYTQAEWEAAATEAAKVPEGELRKRLIEEMVLSRELREKLAHEKQANESLRDQIAAITQQFYPLEKSNRELREKLSLTENHVRFVDGKFGEMKTERDQLCEKLAAAQTQIQDLLTSAVDLSLLEQERDRLRKTLEEARVELCSDSDFSFKRVFRIIDAALAQPAEGTKE